MKKLINILGQDVILQVEGLQINVVNHKPACAGFDSLTIGNAVSFHHMRELNESNLPALWIEQITLALDAMAFEQVAQSV